MKWQIWEFFWVLLDVLFPPRCAGCNTWGRRLCDSCFEEIDVITGEICGRCGVPLISSGKEVCSKCQIYPGSIDSLKSWAYFSGPLQKSIHRLKYHRDLSLGSTLSKPLFDLLQMQSWKIDLIVPVPLDQIRRKQRGYNQAALLANPLSAGAGIPMRVNALRRVRKTCSQVGLSIEERMRNVHEAFSAADSIVSRQSVLLIDDVVTTGATLNACSVALKKAGAKFVYGLTLARSLRLQDAGATITKRRYR